MTLGTPRLCPIAGGIKTHLPQQHQDVHCGVPPVVPRRTAPPPVGRLEGKQPRPVPSVATRRASGRDLLRRRTDQVSHRLPADRRVRIKQPLCDRPAWFRGLPFGRIGRHLLVLLRAYPNNPAARKAIKAQAKCRNAM